MTLKRVMSLCAVMWVGAMVAGAAKADGWVNGFWEYPYTYYTNNTVFDRPGSAQDGRNGVAVYDYRISNLPINEKGINITGTQDRNSGVYWAYRWIAIWHCEISDCWATPGIHQDFIRLAGVGWNQNIWTSILIQDIKIHDGVGIPVFIQDVLCDCLVLKDIRIYNTTLGITIGEADNTYCKQVWIDHCPNISVALIGVPGSIGTVYVKNSPGIRVGNTKSRFGLGDAKIVYLD